MKLKKCEDRHGLRVCCYKCAAWINLADAYADSDGEPWKAYYCSGCHREFENEKHLDWLAGGQE